MTAHKLFSIFRFSWGSWVNIYCRHFSILVQKQRFSTHSSLGFLSWLYVGPVPDFALTSFDFLHTNKWLKSVGLINHRHWITTAAAAAATCCQGDIILGNLSTRSGWCFGANGGGESTRGAAERPISSTAIHAKGRKSDLERKKRCLMGCSRSVTCLTGTISLTGLICHSEASVYRLLITRAPECFMSKSATCTEKPGSYLGN